MLCTCIAPCEPEELTIQSQSATHNSLTLSWKPPKPSVGSSFQYRVEYRKINEEFQKLVELPDNFLTYKVTELSADTEYYFRVAAMNSAGCGPYKDAANSHFTSKLHCTMHQLLVVCYIFTILSW